MIDSHIHFTDKAYDNKQEAILTEAQALGLETMMLIGCDYEEIKKTISFLQEHDNLYGAIGYHPIEFNNVTNENLEELFYLLDKKNIVALGEIGLDYYWYPNDKEPQKELFKKQLEIADKKNIPVVIHARDALDDTYEILKEYPNVSGVIHSFSGTSEEAQKFVDLGYLIGLTGPITFKNGINQKDVAKNIALDKLLIETDGPYLTPVPYRGKINMPQYIYYVAKEIAQQKGIDVDTVLKTTTKNYKAKFLGVK